MDRYEKDLELARAYYDKDGNAFLDTIFPELKESRDKQIWKAIIKSLDMPFPEDNLPGTDITYEEAVAWLEKQKENIEKEYVFRPLAGTDITVAAEQAIRRANEGDRLVLAFNGAYIPVRKGCNANKIVDIYDAFIEKQKDHFRDDTKMVEQKPADDKAFEKWIDEWWKHNKVKNPDSYDKGDEIQFDKRGFKNFCRGIRNMYAEQKPAEWSEEDTEMYINVASSLRGYACGLENEEHKKHIKKGLDWLENRFKSLRSQPKAELTLLDKNIISAAVAFVDLNPYNYWCGIDKRTVIKALRSLRPSWRPSEDEECKNSK